MNHQSFLQSPDWARFQEAVGHRIVKSNGLFFYETKIPFGHYLYCPHPDIKDNEKFLSNVVEVAQKQKTIFVRLEPNVGSSDVRCQLSNVKVVPTLPIQPPHTWHVPISYDDMMLKAMHPKTRYNIRIAEKAGVVIRFSTEPKDVNVLVNLLGKTAERAKIRLHPASYYQKMVEILGEKTGLETSSTLQIELVIAEKDNYPIATALIAYWQDQVIYLHGGSDYEYRSLMAPHLLHWQIMRRARDSGRTVYDMGGIAPTTQELRIKNQELSLVNSNHPWSGITRFKMGFGGYAVDYPEAVDLIIHPVYYSIYSILRSIRRSLI